MTAKAPRKYVNNPAAKALIHLVSHGYDVVRSTGNTVVAFDEAMSFHVLVLYASCRQNL
jgi:hypothetical protein